jgi:hypothetical protein
MDTQDLLNDTGNVQDELGLLTQTVPGPEKLLKLTSDEIHLGLLHLSIKCSANVLTSPAFESIPWAQYRLFQLCLLVGCKASALVYFKLFFTNAMFSVLVQNTNLYAITKEAWTTTQSWGR